MLSMAGWILSMENHNAASLGIFFQVECASHLQCPSHHVLLLDIQVTWLICALIFQTLSYILVFIHGDCSFDQTHCRVGDAQIVHFECVMQR